MFQLEELREVRVASVTNRVERHGDEEKPAVSLALELTDANTMLDLIDAKIREALYKAADGQEQLPGVEPSTPVLRCNAFERHTLAPSYEGWTLSVDDGIDDSTPMVFGSSKVDKFVVEAKQGGSVVLRFRVGTSDVDADKLGKLAMHNGQLIWITLLAPKLGTTPIDGTTEAFQKDHPEADDLFAAGSLGDDDEDGEAQDDEDASPDLEDRLDNALAQADAELAPEPERRGDSPFPKSAPSEAPPQSVTTTRSPAGSRTARGREKMKAALEAGAKP